MIRLLLDEHISPALASRLAGMAVYAQSVPHAGLSGRTDAEVWRHALAHDLTVVTAVDVHPGLIVLREGGLSREEQWERLKPVIEHLKNSREADPLLNRD